MKLVIGLVGPPLAGKETAGKTLEKLFVQDSYSVSHHRFSDVLRATLDIWGIPHGRENEQKLARVMMEFGKNTLSMAVKNLLRETNTDVGILDGVRWFSDEKMIREFPEEGIKSLVLYISASPDRRYQRQLIRDRAGEATMPREEFDRQGKAENEIYIPEIGNRADIKLENNYDNVADFERDIERAYREKIKKLID